MTTKQTWHKSPLLYLGLILAIYCVLLVPTVARHGISWDEQTDIHIARAYLVRRAGWWIGSPDDPSQTRLPMYAVALVYALRQRDSLVIGRLVSVAVGALTIVGLYLYCKREFGAKAGLLAAGILATSPFYLSFARIAFTESDVYVACAFAWLLFCMSHLRERGTIGWAAVSGFVLGLAISAKFTAVTLFPAVLLNALVSSRSEGQGERVAGKQLLVGAALIVLAGALVLVGWRVAPSPRSARFPSEEEVWFRLVHYALVALGWVLVLVWAARHRRRSAHPLLLASLVVALSLLTFVVLPPVHLTNRAILSSLLDRFRNEINVASGFRIEAAALHVGCIIFKSSPAMGVLNLVAVAAACMRWRKEGALRFPLLLLAAYAAGLVMLPIAQTFYTVPLLPVLAALAADGWLRLVRKVRVVGIMLGIVAVAWLAVDLWLCYPDYNLNGYQYLGARRIATRSTIGYRSIVQTTSDGVEQAARWLGENAKPGDRVVAYLYPWHIVQATLPDSPFVMLRGEEDSWRGNPDYVVVHINHTIHQPWTGGARTGSVYWHPIEPEILREQYDLVFSVPRAFGIEMVQVWKRKA